MKFPEESSRLIVTIATQSKKANLRPIARNLCFAATTLLRSSFIVPGITVLENIIEVTGAELLPPRLITLLTKALGISIDADDVDSATTIAKIIINYVPSTQERPPELNDLIKKTTRVITDTKPYTDWLEGKTKPVIKKHKKTSNKKRVFKKSI